MLLAVVLGVAGSALFGCTASSSARTLIVGVNSDITWGIPLRDVHTELALIDYAGVKWIRASVPLNMVESAGRGRLNRGYLHELDTEIRTARAAGQNVMLEFDRAPYWASADPAKHIVGHHRDWRPYWTYRDPRQYARIVAELVSRYRRLGVSTFELWNEPNNPTFWPSGPSARAYTRLLRAAYRRIKAVDARATVLMGGLMPQGSYGFLRGMYAAGARGYYDAANFHVYPAGPPGVCGQARGRRPSVFSFCVLDGLRAIMTAHHDRVPVWVSELGWSTCTQRPCVSEAQQRDYVASSYRLLSQPRYDWVRAAFIYQMRDLYWKSSGRVWANRLGLLDRDFLPKPGYSALLTITGTERDPAPAPSVVRAALGPLVGQDSATSLPAPFRTLGRGRRGSRTLDHRKWMNRSWGLPRVYMRTLWPGGAWPAI